MVRGEVPHPIVCRTVRQLYGRRTARRVGLTFDGREKVPMEGAAIAVANHRNDKIDIPSIGWTILRQAFYPAKDELDQGLRGWVLGASGALFFRRGDRTEEVRIAREMDSVLDDEHMLVVMWEGRSKNRGVELGEVFDSPAGLALGHSLDIIPIAVAGTEDPDTRRVHVSVGDPVPSIEFRPGNFQGSRSQARKEYAAAVKPIHQELIYSAHEKLSD